MRPLMTPGVGIGCAVVAGEAPAAFVSPAGRTAVIGSSATPGKSVTTIANSFAGCPPTGGETQRIPNGVPSGMVRIALGSAGRLKPTSVSFVSTPGFTARGSAWVTYGRPLISMLYVQ